MTKELAKTTAAAICIACVTGLAWAQSTPAEPPFIKFQNGGPYVGAPAAAPAMSLKDVPLHPAEASGQVPKLTFVSPSGTVAHMLPTVQAAAARAAAGLGGTGPSGRSPNASPIGLSGPLLYHTGGSVMLPYVAVYNIYWAPSHLQSGVSTGFSSLYGTVTILHNAWLEGHGLLDNATQYYQTISGTTTYFANNGGLGGYYIDSSAYPASGCTDSATPGNCITDSQIQSEITKVMNANGWTGGMNKVYVLYTSSGEGSCFDNSGASCAYTQYCAYHSFFTLSGQNVMYANIPYGNPSGCQAGGQTTPNDAYADLAVNVTAHEVDEAGTDPLLNAWYDSSGNEIADLCNFNFGTNTWDSGQANQMWNGWFFELQQMWDNHTGGCVQVGP
jgi:hypothetical protein